MDYTSNAKTPEEFRDAFSKFMLSQAIEKRAQARIANTQKAKREYEAKAETYEYVHTFLNNIKFEKEPIPNNVYYREGNFYSFNTKIGMGEAFYMKWRHRASDFPSHP